MVKSGDGEWEKLGGGLPQETCGGVKKDTTCAGVTFVDFDKASGINDASRTNIFYVGVYDDGVYKTTDGGDNFVKRRPHRSPVLQRYSGWLDPYPIRPRSRGGGRHETSYLLASGGVSTVCTTVSRLGQTYPARFKHGHTCQASAR